jgi:hypothetical protein
MKMTVRCSAPWARREEGAPASSATSVIRAAIAASARRARTVGLSVTCGLKVIEAVRPCPPARTVPRDRSFGPRRCKANTVAARPALLNRPGYVRPKREHMFAMGDGETRRCTRCGQVQVLTEFAWHRRAKGQRNHYCRSCQSEYGKAHYAANRQRYLDLEAKRKRARAEKRMRFLLEYFRSNPCVDCGESDPLVLEFDHLRDKSFDICSSLPDRNWRSILAEIAKCEVVCANCHRRRTAQRVGTVRAALAQGVG